MRKWFAFAVAAVSFSMPLQARELPASARVVRIDGSLSENGLALRMNVPLAAGETIVAGDGSRAEIEIAGGRMASLAAGAWITIGANGVDAYGGDVQFADGGAGLLGEM